VTQQISAKVVRVKISVLEKSVHDAQCVITAQLQHKPSVIIYVSTTMLANHTILFFSVVSNACI